MPRQKKTAMKGRRRVAKRTYRRKPKVNSITQLSRDNYAKMSDTMSSSTALTMDTVENFFWNLSAFKRASAVAANYQEFKLDYVECRIKPYYDTFLTPPSTSAPTITKAPQLYTMIIKDGDTPANLDAFKQSGINPRSLAKDGNIVIRLKPAIRVGQINNSLTGGFTTIKVSPWLNTNDTAAATFTPNTAAHYGISYYIDSQEASALTSNIGQIEFEAHFLFRKPMYINTSPNAPKKVNGELVQA